MIEKGFEALRVIRGRIQTQAVDLILFRQQEIRQQGTVLTRNACDKRDLFHVHPAAATESYIWRYA